MILKEEVLIQECKQGQSKLQLPLLVPADNADIPDWAFCFEAGGYPATPQ